MAKAILRINQIKCVLSKKNRPFSAKLHGQGQNRDNKKKLRAYYISGDTKHLDNIFTRRMKRRFVCGSKGHLVSNFTQRVLEPKNTHTLLFTMQYKIPNKQYLQNNSVEHHSESTQNNRSIHSNFFS